MWLYVGIAALVSSLRAIESLLEIQPCRVAPIFRRFNGADMLVGRALPSSPKRAARRVFQQTPK